MAQPTMNPATSPNARRTITGEPPPVGGGGASAWRRRRAPRAGRPPAGWWVGIGEAGAVERRDAEREVQRGGDGAVDRGEQRVLADDPLEDGKLACHYFHFPVWRRQPAAAETGQHERGEAEGR